eukprot:187925-Prymnesium_polylepis.2
MVFPPGVAGPPSDVYASPWSCPPPSPPLRPVPEDTADGDAVDGVVARPKTLFEKVSQLRYAPRDLYLIYSIKFAESVAYYAFSYTYAPFLSREFGMSDVVSARQRALSPFCPASRVRPACCAVTRTARPRPSQEAGNLYALYGVLCSVFGLIAGPAIDAMELRSALLLGTIPSFAARLISALTTDNRVVSLCSMSLLPLGAAFGLPVFALGVRRFTHTENRAFAFTIFYAVLCFGSAMGGMLITVTRACCEPPYGIARPPHPSPPHPRAPHPRNRARTRAAARCTPSRLFFRALLPAATLRSAHRLSRARAAACATVHDGIDLPWPFACHLSWMRINVLFCAACTLYTCAASCFVRNLRVQQSAPLEAAALEPLPTERPGLMEVLSVVCGSKPFWKLLAVSLTVAVGTRATFRHLDATFPKYFMREGPARTNRCAARARAAHADGVVVVRARRGGRLSRRCTHGAQGDPVGGARADQGGRPRHVAQRMVHRAYTRQLGWGLMSPPALSRARAQACMATTRHSSCLWRPSRSSPWRSASPSPTSSCAIVPPHGRRS